MLLYKFIERKGFKVDQFGCGNGEWVKTLWQGLYVMYRRMPHIPQLLQYSSVRKY